MRAECPGCRELFELPGAEIVSERRTVAAACPRCGSQMTIGCLAARVAVAEASPDAPAAAAGPLSAPLKSHILRSLVNLPAMPMVILKAREVMADPDAGLRDLARIIENDPALVGRVLSIANSAYYGLSGQVSTLGHAAVLLGLETLGTIIVTAAAANLLNRELKAYGIDPTTLWRHALGTAHAARRIASRRCPTMQEDAFVVGLIHDAGKIILDPYLAGLGGGRAADGPLTLARERGRLGLDHAEIMARACRFWRFPEAVVQAVRHHHHPSQAADGPLAAVAHLADLAAHRAGLGAGPAESDAAETERARERLDCGESELAETAAAALHDVEETAQVLTAA